MLSLYRRHRPKTFDEVVGQESVVRTLRNAIELGKVHHAYLFVGSRGTGKTSMAKLLAAALNAEDGPRVDFDPEDPAVRAIMTGNSLDVVEMDAASNNSVDDIRELRENVALSPMTGSRRVYILDEAHMLSPAAWNAFLKTLEEPPAHVVFVLATTEAHKVPPTIVDRCHRFDFQRPSLEQLAGVVKRVADQEGISIPDPAVGMIARKATGSFRDALGTLEQLVTYGGKDVQLEDVLETLGVADAELILDTTEALAATDPRAALECVGKLSASGRDYAQFMRDLSAHLRHLYVIQTLGEVPDSFAVTAEHGDRLAGQAERLRQAEILRAIDLLASANSQVKEGSEPRLQLEVALLKATQPQSDQSLQALMHRLDRLEARLAGDGGAAPAPAQFSNEPASAPRSAEPATQEETPQASAAPPAAPHSAGAALATAAVAERAARAEPEIPQQSDFEPQHETPVDLERLRQLWSAVADTVREQNAMVAALVAEAVPSAFEGNRVTISFPEDASFSKKKAEANREVVLNAIRSLTGRAIGVAFELGGAREAMPATTLSPDELAERLKHEFAAEEVFDEDEPE